MNSLLEYFDAAYLINLAERTDRLASAKKEFARAGWRMGEGGVEHYVAQRFTDRAGFPFPECRGCFHSHAECIRKAWRDGRQNVLVMEDDIALAVSTGALTPAVVAQLNSMPWDFLYLGHEDTGDIGRATPRTRHVDFLPYGGSIRGTHSYAVNGRIFERLLAHLDRVANGVEGDQEYGPMPIDGAFNIFRFKNADVQTFIARPKIGWQRSSRSDISPKAFDGLKLLRPFLAMLRDLKSTTMRWHS
jgi:hypothetical protein